MQCPAPLRERGLLAARCRPNAEVLRASTQSAYNCYIEKWRVFAAASGVDPNEPCPVTVANFIASLVDSGAGFSAANSARSALSAFLPLVDGRTVGSHPHVCRLLKGVFEEKSALPKYCDTWDVNCVLDYLDSLSPLANLSLRELTL